MWSRLWSIDLKKKYGDWVVITGATDGIGLEYAREFARRGHSLILVGRSEAKLAKVKTELSRLLNPNLIVTVCADFNAADAQVSLASYSLAQLTNHTRADLQRPCGANQRQQSPHRHSGE